MAAEGLRQNQNAVVQPLLTGKQNVKFQFHGHCSLNNDTFIVLFLNFVLHLRVYFKIAPCIIPN